MSTWADSAYDFSDKASKWFWAFFEKEGGVDDLFDEDEEKQEQDISDDSALVDLPNYEEMFNGMLRRNTAFHDIMTAFNVLLASESGKITKVKEDCRENLHWAFQQREVADKFKENSRRDFVSVLEAVVERLSSKVEMLAAEKDWLLGKQAEQETLRDELMRTRNDVLRDVFKSMQAEFLVKVREIGIESYIASLMKNKNRQPLSSTPIKKGKNAISESNDSKLVEDFWSQLNNVNEVVADGESRLGILANVNSRVVEKVDSQKQRLSQLQQQMDVLLLRFVSENDFLLHSAAFQLQVVELLNEMRRLGAIVEHLQSDVIALKNKRLGVEVGLEVLRSEDVDIGRAVCELGKYLRFIDTITP